jgi:prevent-host-death family protein
MMTRITASNARKEFGRALDRAARKGKRVVIQRRGKDVAVLVPIEDVRLLDALIEKYEDTIDIKAAKQALKEPGSVSLEELKADLGL